MTAKQFAKTPAAMDVMMDFAHMCAGGISFKSESVVINGKSVEVYATLNMTENTYDKVDISHPSLKDLMHAEFEIEFFDPHTGRPILEV